MIILLCALAAALGVLLWPNAVSLWDNWKAYGDEKRRIDFEERTARYRAADPFAGATGPTDYGHLPINCRCVIEPLVRKVAEYGPLGETNIDRTFDQEYQESMLREYQKRKAERDAAATPGDE